MVGCSCRIGEGRTGDAGLRSRVGAGRTGGARLRSRVRAGRIGLEQGWGGADRVAQG